MERVTMQALKLDATAGWRWVAGGWRMFRKQPFGFIATLFLFWLVLLSSAMAIGFVAQTLGAVLPGVSPDALETIGSLLFAVLTPALTVGFLQACRVADTNLPVHPLLLFAPFRAGRTTVRRLLLLGLLQAVALAVIAMATNAGTDSRSSAPTAATAPSKAAPDKPASAPSADTQKADEEEIRTRAAEITLQGIAYLPVALLMWYSPMLIAWHGLPVGKSLFFNLVGMWRNRAAFVVYFAAWAFVWMGASVAVAIVAALVGVANVAAIVVAPIAMVLLTCMYCSMYQTYSTVYVETPRVDEVVEAPRVDDVAG
jgi:hypothetical protein